MFPVIEGLLKKELMFRNNGTIEERDWIVWLQL